VPQYGAILTLAVFSAFEFHRAELFASCSTEPHLGTDHERQDLLWKFNLSANERTKVLHSLDIYNLNSYSLFGTEESLMETMAQREILFRQ
jgi:hypothetical protein